MANDILRAAEKYGRLRKSQFAVGPRSALCSGLGQVARVRLSTLFEANVSTFLAVSTPHGHRTILAAKAGMMPIDAGVKRVKSPLSTSRSKWR
jgi:hypothetical protein